MRDHKPPGAQTVGIRELKARAAGILRRVREEQASYIVTHRGRAVGVLLPADPREGAEERNAGSGWAAFMRAGRRLEGAFRPGKSATKALSSSRR